MLSAKHLAWKPLGTWSRTARESDHSYLGAAAVRMLLISIFESGRVRSCHSSSLIIRSKVPQNSGFRLILLPSTNKNQLAFPNTMGGGPLLSSLPFPGVI